MKLIYILLLDVLLQLGPNVRIILEFYFQNLVQ